METMERGTKAVTLSAGIATAILAGLVMLSSCGNVDQDKPGYPNSENNPYSAVKDSNWLLKEVKYNTGAYHYYYGKGDSTRYIMTVEGKIWLDDKWLNLDCY